MVPLVGLGSDQVEKAWSIENNVEAYHVDEHKFGDAHALRDRLTYLTDEERDHVSIMLFMSPQSLTEGSSWLKLLERTAKKRPLVPLLYRRGTYRRNMWA
mmetsp:Transcript_15257/g.32288  ORF Transcript_15257/g.32288 Transcript_15257/m.32288 type:complete len:100 (+) Transcript_15257:682-981(+)